MKKNKKPYNHRERLYVLWMGIKQRCKNPNNISYKNYGAKGIKVCQEWENDYLSFKKWALDNGYDESLPRGVQTIDRINANGNYEPSNCRWVSIQEQQRNKSNVQLYEYNGQVFTLPEWAEILNIDYSLLHGRIFVYGWSIKDAIEKPSHYRCNGGYVKVDIDGKKKTLLEVSKETGISYTVLKKKYDKGIDIKDVIKEYEEKGKFLTNKYEYNGKKLTIPEWSKELGISESALRYRLSIGKPYEQVFTKEKQCFKKNKTGV